MAPLIAESVAEVVVSSQNLSIAGGFSVPSPTAGFPGASKDAPQSLAATFGPATEDCDAGGAATTSGTLAVPASITVGDTLSFEFFECNDSNGVVVDGRLEFEIVAFSGEVAMGMITLTVAMTLDALQFVQDAAGSAVNGELSFTIDTTNIPEAFIALSSSKLTITSASESKTLVDYIMTMTVNPVVGTVTMNSSATLQSSMLPGTFSYVMPESLVFGSDGAPLAGRIVVSGAGGATLTITILGAEQVELEIDLDGNETIDEVIVTSWADLSG